VKSKKRHQPNPSDLGRLAPDAAPQPPVNSQEAAGAAANFHPAQRLLGFLLVLATVVAYGPAFHAGFIWDDDLYVTENPLLTAPDGLWRIWFSLDSPSQYFPLTYTVFRFQHALWALMPAGYHWCNIVLHAANALLVWRLLQRLRVPGAWLAAAIFALHPVQVESVAWITELKNILSLFFILLALLAWLEFIEEKVRPDWRWYLLALLGQALALAAKTTACTLPAALLLLLWLQHKPIRWQRLVQLIPFLILGAGMGLLTIWWERYHQGTQGKLFAMNFTERLLVAGHAFWFYLGKLIWPANLMFSYPRWTINAANPFAYGWLAAGAALGAAIYFLRRRLGRGPEVAALFFALTLSPLLGFIMLYTFLYTFVADHYQYVACLGPIALAAAGLAKISGAAGKKFSPVGMICCGALLMTLATLTWRQCGIYADQKILWQTTIQRNPGSWLARANLGTWLARNGRTDEAIALWRDALRINPEDAFAYYDLGVADAHAGRVEAAVANYQKALECEPDLVKACNKLAWVLATCPLPSIRDAGKAVEFAQRANQLTHGADPEILGTLAAAEAYAGKFPEAVMLVQRALQLAPEKNDPGLLNGLQTQLKFYQANSTFRDLSLTNAVPGQ
jgi:tetratricopeptide (TPR) repeat protein